MALAAIIISMWGSYYKAFKCDKMASFYDSRNELLDAYPLCASPEEWVAVKADLVDGEEENASAALYLTFGMAIWLSLALHAIGVEIYVSYS